MTLRMVQLAPSLVGLTGRVGITLYILWIMWQVHQQPDWPAYLALLGILLYLAPPWVEATLYDCIRLLTGRAAKPAR